jgi:FkbM family methyltransferase
MSRWDWDAFEGSREMLRYMRRDVSILRQAVRANVNPRRVALQAGGALGIFPKYLAQTFEWVYTFEPDPENFLSMCRNAPERNIVKFQAALGCDRTLVNISHERRSSKPGNAHEGIRHVDGPGMIPTLQIDDLNLPVCDLIYLDIEGYELFALNGALATIQRCRPVVCFELNEMASYVGVTPSRLAELMSGLDYQFREQVGTSDQLYWPKERAA